MTLLALLLSSFFGMSNIGYGFAPIIQEGKRWKVTFNVHHKFKGSEVTLSKVHIYTDDRKFAFYLADHKLHSEEWIEDYSDKFTCHDFLTPVLFVQYEHKLGKHLRYRYWKKQKRWVGVPDILTDAETYRPLTCYLP